MPNEWTAKAGLSLWKVTSPMGETFDCAKSPGIGKKHRTAEEAIEWAKKIQAARAALSKKGNFNV